MTTSTGLDLQSISGNPGAQRSYLCEIWALKGEKGKRTQLTGYSCAAVFPPGYPFLARQNAAAFVRGQSDYSHGPSPVTW